MNLPTVWWRVQCYICQFALYSRSNWSGCYKGNISNIRQLKIFISRPFRWVNPSFLTGENGRFIESINNKTSKNWYLLQKTKFIVTLRLQLNHPEPGFILGLNWVRFPDAALNDLCFSKIHFMKTITKRPRTLGEVKLGAPFWTVLWWKSAFFCVFWSLPSVSKITPENSSYLLLKTIRKYSHRETLTNSFFCYKTFWWNYC